MFAARYNKLYLKIITLQLFFGIFQLKYKINKEEATFVGVQTSNLGALNITSSEMKGIIEMVLECNGVAAQVVQANGLLLKGDEIVYDVLSILNRGNG